MSSDNTLSPPWAGGGKPAHNPPLMTESRKVGRQVVFRVRDPRAPARKAPRRSKAMTTEDSATEPVAHARKSHRKSRSGCGNCKKRRVKCDETRPGCQKCEAYGIPCDYTSRQPGSSPTDETIVARRNGDGVDYIDTSVGSLSIADTVARINNALGMGSSSRSGPAGPPLTSSSSAIACLHKFVHGTRHYGYMPDGHRKVLSGELIRLAFSSNYLMHALLGAALGCGRLLNDDNQHYHVPEAFHWQQAIKHYQQDLVSPIGPHNMDPLLSTCILLSIMSFSEKEYNPRDSWLFSTDHGPLNWFLVQGGLRCLIYATLPWLKDSIWATAFAESDGDDKEVYDDHTPGAEGLHPELAELCEIHETTTEDNSAYHWPLRLLTPCLKLELNRHTFTKLCGFMGRMEPPYLELLKKRDERAVLIFGYWLGKMCEDKTCFGYPRFSAECYAICMYLEHSLDPRILTLLQYPAERCGYVLKQVVDVETLSVGDLQLDDLLAGVSDE